MRQLLAGTGSHGGARYKARVKCYRFVRWSLIKYHFFAQRNDRLPTHLDSNFSFSRSRGFFYTTFSVGVDTCPWPSGTALRVYVTAITDGADWGVSRGLQSSNQLVFQPSNYTHLSQNKRDFCRVLASGYLLRLAILRQPQ